MEPAGGRPGALSPSALAASFEERPTTIATGVSREQVERLLSSHPPLQSDPLKLIGESIHGGHVVRELISQGGLSLVYRAINPDTGRSVALKCFHGVGELPKADLARFRRRFQRISEVVGELSADQLGLVRPLAQGWIETGNRELPCLLMEWVDGATLEALLDVEREQALVTRSAGEVVSLMQHAIEALAAAHARGLIHRDVKPSNIYVAAPRLDAGAAVRVLDFSLARFMDEEVGHAGVTFMTPDYAAPEQFNGYEAQVGPWTDVFSLALVLVEMMLGGRPALRGEEFEDLKRASLDPKRRPTPGSFGLEIPNAVESVFKRALAVETQDRFSNAGHFLKAITRAIEAEGGKVTSTGISRVSGEFDHDETFERTRRRRRGAIQPASPGVPGLAPAQTGETVVALAPVRAPVRTGETVLAPAPTSDDS